MSQAIVNIIYSVIYMFVLSIVFAGGWNHFLAPLFNIELNLVQSMAICILAYLPFAGAMLNLSLTSSPIFHTASEADQQKAVFKGRMMYLFILACALGVLMYFF
jgi:hypothetical protein